MVEQACGSNDSEIQVDNIRFWIEKNTELWQTVFSLRRISFVPPIARSFQPLFSTTVSNFGLRFKQSAVPPWLCTSAYLTEAFRRGYCPLYRKGQVQNRSVVVFLRRIRVESLAGMNAVQWSR